MSEFKVKNAFLKFDKWLNEKESYVAPIAGVILVLGFTAIFLSFAYVNRLQLIAYFDKGMEYYEAGNYEKALDYFGDLVNWKIGERNGNEMYRATLKALNKESERDMYYCPWCGRKFSLSELNKQQNE